MPRKTTEVVDLHARLLTHGPYRTQFTCAQALKGVAKDYNYHGLGAVQREGLEMILMKLSRVLTGDAHHRDHWADIAGYATLMADECPAE